MGNSQHKDEDPKKASTASGAQESHEAEDGQAESKKSVRSASDIGYAFIAAIIVALSIAIIAVSVSAALSTKLYTATNSSRAVGLVILDVSVAISMTVALFSASALWRRQQRQIVIAAIAFIALLIAQAVLVSVCVQVKKDDKDQFSKALVESFQLAQQDNLRAVRLWHATQHEMKCCGVISSEDYKDRKMPPYFPAEIPISCCPSYEPSRTTYMQERNREMCKIKHQYYKDGCRDKVLHSLEETENVLTWLVALLIICEVLVAIWSIVHVSKAKKNPDEGESDENIERSGAKEPEKPPTKKNSEINLKLKA